VRKNRGATERGEGPMREVMKTFDYGELPAGDAEALRKAAQRIRSLIDKGKAALAEIGRELMVVRTRLPRNQFTRWATSEFGITNRTALNYMRYAEWGTDKTEIVSVLQPNSVYLLAAPSTPQSARTAVIGRVRSGEVLGPNMVRTLIKKAKLEEAEAKLDADRAAALARLSPEERKRRESEEADRRRRVAAEYERVLHVMEERDQLTREAAALILDRLGPELGQFLAVTEGVSWYELRNLLKDHWVDERAAQGFPR
jgi:hypothetical protein